jgi:hypothetical protein
MLSLTIEQGQLWGFALLFRPTYALANVGHPSASRIQTFYDTSSCRGCCLLQNTGSMLKHFQLSDEVPRDERSQASIKPRLATAMFPREEFFTRYIISSAAPMISLIESPSSG